MLITVIYLIISNLNQKQTNNKLKHNLSSILLTLYKLKVWMTIVESGWNVWVWLSGGGCGWQEAGVASGWNVWVWLSGGGCGWQEAGVASGWNVWVWLSGGGCGWKLSVWLVGVFFI